MITTYNANRDTTIKDGKVTVSFGLSVEGISQADARMVEHEIDTFLARICAPTKGHAAIPWSDLEKETVRKAATREEAWARYQAEFPDSIRGKSAVTRWWDQYHEEPAPVGKLPESVPEKADPAPAPAAEPAKKPSAQKILKAKAKPAKVQQGKGNNNRSIAGDWSPEEVSVVKGCKDKETAIGAYRLGFPDSKRNDNAIYLKWHALEKRAKEEAKQKKKAAKVQKTAENVEVPPQAADEGGDTVINISGSEELLKDIHAPRSPDPAPPVVQEEDIGATSHDEAALEDDGSYKVGDRVKQVNGSAIFTGIGKIKRAPSDREEVLVQFDNGMNWIARSNLAKVA